MAISNSAFVVPIRMAVVVVVANARAGALALRRHDKPMNIEITSIARDGQSCFDGLNSVGPKTRALAMKSENGIRLRVSIDLLCSDRAFESEKQADYSEALRRRV
jgi:hypothetical protein